MNTEQTRICIHHVFTDGVRLDVDSDRTDNTIELTQYDIDGKGYNITLTHDQAYKLIDLIKTAMEVKL